MSYQPEVDCLTAVDGLHVVSLRKPATFNRRSSTAGTSQAAEKPSLAAESMNRFSVPGLVQWSRRVAEYLRQRCPSCLGREGFRVVVPKLQK